MIVGFALKRIFGKHIMVALLPCVHLLCVSLPAAVTAQDIPLVQGVVVFGALIFVTTNLVIDLVYPLLDPRIVVASGRRAALA